MSHQSTTYQSTNPAGAKALLDQGDHVLLDVRTVEEFDEGHVAGSYNVPFAFRSAHGMELNPAFASVIERLFPKDTKLVLV